MLTSPSQKHFADYIRALREGMHSGEGPWAPEKIAKVEGNPAEFFEEIDRNTLSSGTIKLADGTTVERVPQTILWYIDNNSFIGDVQIRHYLTDSLRMLGGHIGYGIRPSQQRQGYATKMLAETLLYCQKNLGLNEFLLTCDDTNIGSFRTMEKNGGILEKVIPHPYKEGVLSRRYWIRLQNKEILSP